MTAPLVLKLHGGGGYVAIRLAGPTPGAVEAFRWQQPPSAWRPFGNDDLQVSVDTARALAEGDRRSLAPLHGAVEVPASPTSVHLVLAGVVLNRHDARRLLARLGDPWSPGDVDVEHDSGLPVDDLAEQRRELRDSRGEVDTETGEGFRGRRW